MGYNWDNFIYHAVYYTIVMSESQNEIGSVESLTEGDAVAISNMKLDTTGEVERVDSDTWGTDGVAVYVNCASGETVTLTNHGRDNPLVREGITANVGGSVTVTRQ
jgi:hypothetical protein